NAQTPGGGLRVQRARGAVAIPASDADAVGRCGLVTQDPAGSVEGVMAGGREVVRELLDPRLVGEGRERIRRTRGGVGRLLAPCAPDLVEVLGLRVVRLHVRVVDRPGGRDAIMVVQLAEVLLSQAVERRPVELRGSS